MGMKCDLLRVGPLPVSKVIDAGTSSVDFMDPQFRKGMKRGILMAAEQAGQYESHVYGTRIPIEDMILCKLNQIPKSLARRKPCQSIIRTMDDFRRTHFPKSFEEARVKAMTPEERTKDMAGRLVKESMRILKRELARATSKNSSKRRGSSRKSRRA